MIWLLLACSKGPVDPDTDLSIYPDYTGEVVLETSMGDVVLALDDGAAPVTVANYLRYVDDGFYDGADGLGATHFHRVVADFVVQGGGYTTDATRKDTYPPISNESDNGLSNLRGTVAMARTNDPDSATSQFYVNLSDNTSLDVPPGYAVFGAVREGMDVVDAIAGVEVSNEVPLTPVTIDAAFMR